MNQKMKTNNEKKKKKKNTEFEFCKACNLNHDQGQNHKYLPNHKKSLSNFLSRFQTKLADIRFFLRNPTILRPELASRNRIWCVFCDFDIHETGSYFACAKAISHLASEEHLKKLKHFMWKYGGGMDRVDTFRISEADVAKWEKKCEALGNEASSYSDGSRGMQVGTSNGMSIRYPIQDSLQLGMLGHPCMVLYPLCLWTHVLLQIYAILTIQWVIGMANILSLITI